MNKEANKLSWLDKLKLRKMMPKMKKSKLSAMNFMLIKKTDYELMNKKIDLQYNYISQIKLNNAEISRLKDRIKSISEQLETTENARRKNACKIGGLTTKLNKEKKKTGELLNTIAELENTIKLQELEIEKRNVQNKILKSIGKQKQLEDYQKLVELSKDIEKHKRK